jgi:uncharacterized membrane protein YoaK (UPF0700 family)
MLSARAYSFRQQSRLAISLSWIGGFTNSVAFLACGAVVSHVSGTVTGFGRSLARAEVPEIRFFGFLVGTFWLGAVASATMTEGAKRRGMRSKYIVPLVAEALLLMSVSISLNHHGHIDAGGGWMYWTTGALSFAMGLQNATITKISGAVVRTTHLTGGITDLGLEGVQFLLWYRDRLLGRRWSRAGRILKISQRHPTFERILLLASIAASFLFGALVGTWAWLGFATTAMLVPVCALLGIVYLDWRKPIADVKELDLLSDPELSTYGIVKSLLPPELGIYRFACRHGEAVHRAPNFQLWISRLNPHWSVVILAVSPFTRFDRNSAMDLHEAVKELHTQDRKLIISGITPVQFKALDALGIGNVMDVLNLCPDLEFAIARGMTLIHEMKARRRGAQQRVVAS